MDPLSCRDSSCLLVLFIFYYVLYFILFSNLFFLFLLHRAPLPRHPIRPSCWSPPRGPCWGSFSGTWISLLYTTHSLTLTTHSHHCVIIMPLLPSQVQFSFFLPSSFRPTIPPFPSSILSYFCLSLHSFL